MTDRRKAWQQTQNPNLTKNSCTRCNLNQIDAWTFQFGPENKPICDPCYEKVKNGNGGNKERFVFPLNSVPNPNAYLEYVQQYEFPTYNVNHDHLLDLSLDRFVLNGDYYLYLNPNQDLVFSLEIDNNLPRVFAFPTDLNKMVETQFRKLNRKYHLLIDPETRKSAFVTLISQRMEQYPKLRTISNSKHKYNLWKGPQEPIKIISLLRVDDPNHEVYLTLDDKVIMREDGRLKIIGQLEKDNVIGRYKFTSEDRKYFYDAIGNYYGTSVFKNNLQPVQMSLLEIFSEPQSFQSFMRNIGFFEE